MRETSKCMTRQNLKSDANLRSVQLSLCPTSVRQRPQNVHRDKTLNQSIRHQPHGCRFVPPVCNRDLKMCIETKPLSRCQPQECPTVALSCQCATETSNVHRDKSLNQSIRHQPHGCPTVALSHQCATETSKCASRQNL